MTGECACGAVKVTISAKPPFINDCNCSLCRKTGGAWGYFTSADVTVSGKTSGYVRADKSFPAVAVRSCVKCGCTTHFEMTQAFKDQHPEADQTGVNMRLFDSKALIGVEVRFPDGAAWSGEGAFGHRRPPITIDESTHW